MISAKKIVKSFGNATILHGIDFSVRAGSIHALTGENGAGKSTLMKIIAGVHRPNSGSLELRGKPVVIGSPLEALRMGISTVFQEFTLVPNLSVAENIFLGREPRTGAGAIDYATAEKRSREILGRVGLEFDPRTLVRNLTVAQQQAVEIAKGISADADVFIFDEPSAALNAADVERLEKLIFELRDAGKAVIYISHRLREIFELCDTVTVMKDGRLVATHPTSELSEHDLVALMVGRELTNFFPPRGSSGPSDIALDVRSLRLKAGSPAVSFQLKRGEILGFAGLEGQGQREIARALVGLECPEQSDIIKGASGALRSCALSTDEGIESVIRAGVGFIPEDRKSEGLFLNLSISDNIALGMQIGRPLRALLADARATVDGLVREMKIGTGNAKAAVNSLSGGNQQKALIGRWLASGVDVLVIEEPTRGVDVGAKAEIYRLLRAFVNQGGALLVLSRELLELIGLCDRILVVHGRQIVDEMLGAEATEQRILHAAIGRRELAIESERADEVVLLADTLPASGDNPMTKPGEFKKPGPWKIGMSHYGLAGSTHTYQTAHEAEHAATQIPEVGQYLFLSADLDPDKQAADIDKLIDQKVDALIVAPLSATSASSGIERARVAGIPVVVYLGKTSTTQFTTEIQGDDYYFGKVMAEYLIKETGGQGNIWVLRGVAGHPIDEDRYRGAIDAFKTAPGLQIVAEEHAGWSYDRTRNLCEQLYRANSKVDGVWADGANMSLGCADALAQLGVDKLPPITGEAMNGWLRRWRSDRFRSISPICPPGLGAAAVRAAAALLGGKSVHKSYLNRPAPITSDNLAKFVRADLSDAFWSPTELPEPTIRKLYEAREPAGT
jgi:ribose transport system ATP-binding protein